MIIRINENVTYPRKVVLHHLYNYNLAVEFGLEHGCKRPLPNTLTFHISWLDEKSFVDIYAMHECVCDLISELPAGTFGIAIFLRL